MRLVVNPFWSNADVEDLSTNWVVDQDGVDRRQGCRARAGTVMSHTVNSFAGTHPRPLFWMTLPFLRNGSAPWPAHTNASVDMFEFLWDRTYNQGRTASMKAVAMAREFVNANPSGVTTLNSFIELQWRGTYGGSIGGTSNTAKWTTGLPAVNYFTDSRAEDSFANIGNPTNVVEFGTIRNHGGFRVVDVIIQEDALEELIPALNHSYSDPTLAKPGKFVLDDLAEQVRKALHEIRSTNLPLVFVWSSLGGVADPDMSSPGSLRGMAVNSEVDTGWVNLLDHAVSSRNVSTPGVTGYAHHAGLGINTTVPVTCYVLGERNSSAGDAQVRFESSWTNATADLTYNGTGSLGWVGVTGLNLNSALRDDDPGHGNKIDIFGQTSAGTAMTIYALVGIIQYPT